MKSFDQIADEVAIDKGYDNFNHFDHTFPKSAKEVCKEIAKRYAEQVKPKQYTEKDLKKAIEMAQEQRPRKFFPDEYVFKYTEDDIILSIKEKL